MRIAFLTSGLEPGRDGVGDYCRLLAAALEKLGHSTMLVALNDPFVTGDYLHSGSDQQATGGTLRLCPGQDWDSRFSRAAAFIKDFSPDWISVQFVAYGLNPRGIVSSLEPALARLVEQYATHFNLHELWIGSQIGAPIKSRILGWLQRRSILALLKRCRPLLVTTTNAIYSSLLNEARINSSVLSIFGNIPIESREQGWTAAQLAQAGANEVHQGRDQTWIFVFFGTLHPEWTPEPLFGSIGRAARIAGKSVIMLLLGRPSGGKQMWQHLQHCYGSNFRFMDLGEQSPKRVADVLGFADAGISTMPFELMEKSGSGAAMLDHGLPVIVTRTERFRCRSAGSPEDPLIIRYGDELEAKLSAGLPRRTPRWQLPDIAATFASELGSVFFTSKSRVVP